MVCTLWKVVTVHLYFGNDMVGLITKSLLHCICISGPFNLPDATIKRISNLKEVPVPTLEVKVKIKCRYCCFSVCCNFNDAKWNLGKVKTKPMQRLH